MFNSYSCDALKKKTDKAGRFLVVLLKITLFCQLQFTKQMQSLTLSVCNEWALARRQTKSDLGVWATSSSCCASVYKNTCDYLTEGVLVLGLGNISNPIQTYLTQEVSSHIHHQWRVYTCLICFTNIIFNAHSSSTIFYRLYYFIKVEPYLIIYFFTCNSENNI